MDEETNKKKIPTLANHLTKSIVNSLKDVENNE